MKRILLVKTSSLGDVIHNLPVVSDILQHYPDVQIDWVVEESFADIPPLHPAVKQVFTVAVRRWRKHVFSKQTWHEIAVFKRLISQQPYDLIIDTQGLIKSAVMAKCAQGIKCGHDKNTAREPIASYFYDKKFNVARNQHAVVRNRELAAHACNYSKPNHVPNYGITAKASIEENLPEPYVIGLHGTSKDSKLWPTTHWNDLAKALATQQLQLVLPWASPAEHQRAKNIAAQQSNVLVLPKCSIAQLATTISRAYVAVGVDTGLSHLAAALNIPTVALYTDTQPTLTGVYSGAHAQAINLGGVKKIPSVASVLDAIQSVTEPNT
ncbi:MAG: lipopolysaccharide heptosyltransferase I [Methylophilaceae bacterium]